MLMSLAQMLKRLSNDTKVSGSMRDRINFSAYGENHVDKLDIKRTDNTQSLESAECGLPNPATDPLNFYGHDPSVFRFET